MFAAYHIKDNRPVREGAAISCKRFIAPGNSLWRRAYFSRVLPNGDLVVTFEGDTDESYVHPTAAFGVMVRNY